MDLEETIKDDSRTKGVRLKEKRATDHVAETVE